MSGYFHWKKYDLTGALRNVFILEAFKIKFYCLLKVGFGLLNAFALTDHSKLQTVRNIPSFFFGYYGNKFL